MTVTMPRSRTVNQLPQAEAPVKLVPHEFQQPQQSLQRRVADVVRIELQVHVKVDKNLSQNGPMGKCPPTSPKLTTNCSAQNSTVLRFVFKQFARDNLHQRDTLFPVGFGCTILTGAVSVFGLLSFGPMVHSPLVDLTCLARVGSISDTSSTLPCRPRKQSQSGSNTIHTLFSKGSGDSTR